MPCHHLLHLQLSSSSFKLNYEVLDLPIPAAIAWILSAQGSLHQGDIIQERSRPILTPPSWHCTSSPRRSSFPFSACRALSQECFLLQVILSISYLQHEYEHECSLVSAAISIISAVFWTDLGNDLQRIGGWFPVGSSLLNKLQIYCKSPFKPAHQLSNFDLHLNSVWFWLFWARTVKVWLQQSKLTTVNWKFTLVRLYCCIPFCSSFVRE